MATTKATYTQSGSTTVDFSIPFAYLKSSDVSVYVNGVKQTAWSFHNATTVRFDSAPTPGDKIEIFRMTGVDTLSATFYAGSAVKSEDLNDNFNQTLYRSQEIEDRFVSTDLASTMARDLTMGEDADIIMGKDSNITFEGATDNAHQTTLTVEDPTATRTITLPNVTGTVVTRGDTGSVAIGMIAADAIDGTKIADASINSEHYVDGSIDTAHIADSQVTKAKIAGDAIDGTKIEDNAVDSEHLAADSIDAEHYAAGSVDATALATNAVTTVKITDANVTTAKINDSAVTTAKINADAVDGTKIADNAIDSEHITAGAVDLAHLSANSVDSSKIVDGSIVNADISGSAAIAHSKLANVTDGQILVGNGSNVPTAVAVSGDVTISNTGAVTIATGAVEHAMLAGDAVDGDNIADDSINSEHYVDGSIDTAHIADDAITLAKLAGIARGKIIYGDASGNPAVLAPGSNGQVLKSDGTDISWGTDSTGGGGSGSTDLSATANGTSLTIESSSGNNVSLPAATTSAWGVMSDEDKTKLDGIETSATADQTGAQIKTAYEAESDTNAFTDAEKTKLSGIEASATADQTAAEIRTAVEAASDSNVFTDADHTKLNGIEASADVTDATNVDAAGAVMNSDLDGKGELLVGDGSGDPSALAVGTNGYFLKADSSTATGLTWAASTSGLIFKAHMGTTQDISTATDTTVQINTETFDSDSMYDAGNYKFSPSSSNGYYNLYAKVHLVVGSQDHSIQVSIVREPAGGGSDIYEATSYAWNDSFSSSTEMSVEVSTIVKVEADDSFFVEIWQNAGSTKTVQATLRKTTFQGYFIRGI